MLVTSSDEKELQTLLRSIGIGDEFELTSLRNVIHFFGMEFREVMKICKIHPQNYIDEGYWNE